VAVVDMGPLFNLLIKKFPTSQYYSRLWKFRVGLKMLGKDKELLGKFVDGEFLKLINQSINTHNDSP
jgi:hypothetical protein